MAKEQSRQRIEKLKKVINYHRYLYHVLDKQEISDSALDSLKKELYQLEQQYPEFITSDSPTQRVAGKPLKGFKKVSHQQPMLSIEDIFSEKELQDWENYLKRLICRDRVSADSAVLEYFCEPKIDGLAVSLIYKNGIFVKGATRGDGRIGEDVTQNLKTIESIPLKLRKPHPLVKLEVRGEVYMPKKVFEKINREKEKKGEETYTSPRNIAAGSVRQLDAKLAACRQLSFFAYAIATDLGQEKHSQEHQILKALGFPVVDLAKECRTLEEIMIFWQKINNKRKDLPFNIDGMVINVNQNSVFNKLGIAGKSPRGARAFKFVAEEAVTQVKDIKVQIGRTGAITPIAELKPVLVAGANITRATLHNEDEIKRLGIKIGDTVIVARAGDVIPAIKKVLPEFRTGKEKRFLMPKQCPSCNTLLKRPQGEKIWRCPNLNCYALRKRFLEHFVSKKAFDINGLGPKVISKLLSAGLILSPIDLFELKKQDIYFLDGTDEIKNLQGFAEKSAANLISAIQKSKRISFNHFIYALGIRYLGEQTAIDLAEIFKDINQLQNAKQTELENIPNIGAKTAQTIYQWFQLKRNQKFIKDLLQAGVKITKRDFAGGLTPRSLSGVKPRSATAGKTFVFTGSLEAMSRFIAKEKIRLFGGRVSESVSSKTDYVVVGKKPGFNKLEKAKKLGVKIINKKEFLKLIG
ncbi:MAG: NAD-dependent DNA ligase LigA [Candidatus Pacebacteria bacterium]|nr:NAD-dependent DNA ligase LigA [Candidatus Paceibacterota bacterium]